ncbi:MAG: hypothetical protein R2792_18790 [Saprospiraceae bacterium]
MQKERGDDKFAYRLVYTPSKPENNTEDINFRAQDSNNFEAEWGPGINDRTHVINGFLYWYPSKGLSFTLAALLQSGQPINRIPDASLYGTTDLNGMAVPLAMPMSATATGSPEKRATTTGSHGPIRLMSMPANVSSWGPPNWCFVPMCSMCSMQRI